MQAAQEAANKQQQAALKAALAKITVRIHRLHPHTRLSFAGLGPARVLCMP